MFSFHEKRKIRNVLYSKPVVASILIIAGFASFSAYDRYTIAREMEVRLEERAEERDKLKERAKTLEARVQYLSDERGIEEELRNRFDVAKEGERVVVFVDNVSETPENRLETQKSDTSATSSDTESSFFKSLKFWE